MTRRPGKSNFHDLRDRSCRAACLRHDGRIGYRRRHKYRASSLERCCGCSQNRALMLFLHEKNKMVSQTGRHLKALRKR